MLLSSKTQCFFQYVVQQYREVRFLLHRISVNIITICVLSPLNRNQFRFYGDHPKKIAKDKKDDDPISLGKVFFDTRKAKVEESKQSAETHPYPHEFRISCTVIEYNEKYAHLKNDEVLQGVLESVAGRILSIRRASSKLYFFDLQSDGAKLQVKVYQQIGASKDEFSAEISKYHRGDIIGIEGNPSRTKSGELSINSNTVTFVMLDSLFVRYLQLI